MFVVFSDLVVDSCESNVNSNDKVLPTRYLQRDKVDVNAYQCTLSSLMSLVTVPSCLIHCNASYLRRS